MCLWSVGRAVLLINGAPIPREEREKLLIQDFVLLLYFILYDETINVQRLSNTTH